MVDNCLWFTAKLFPDSVLDFVQLKIHKKIKEAETIEGPENSFRLSTSEVTSTLIKNNRYWYWYCRYWPCIYSIADRSCRVTHRYTMAFYTKACRWSCLCRLAWIKDISVAESTFAEMLLTHYDNHSSHRCGLNDAATTLGTFGCAHLRMNDSDSAAKLSVTDLFCKCRLIVISFCPFPSRWIKAISELRVNNFLNASAARRNFSGGLTVFIIA